MKNLFLLLLFLPAFLQGQITKGTGISYFDSIPNVAPSLPRGTEIAFSIALKKLYRWDRTSSTWIEMKTSTDSLARTVLASGLFNEYAVPFGGSTGKLDQSAAFQFVLGQLQANSFATLGSAGAGYVGLSPQSSVPATPISGIRVYADASGRFGWIGTNGYTRVFDASGITANRTFKLQNKTYTLADSADVASLSASLPGAYFPLPGGTLTGTGGAGFVGFPAQSSAPSAPGAGFRVFANGAGNMGVIRADGYVTTFDFSTATGNRFFTYPANAGTFGILENAQSWTGVNTFAPTGTGGAGFVISTTSRFATIAPVMTDAQAAALTGQTAGGWVYSSTQQRPYVHNGTAFQGVVLGPQAGFTAGQIAYGGTGGNLNSTSNFTYSGGVLTNFSGGFDFRPDPVNNPNNKLYTKVINTDSRWGLFATNGGTDISIMQLRNTQGSVMLGPGGAVSASGAMGTIGLTSGALITPNVTLSNNIVQSANSVSYLSILASNTNELNLAGSSYLSGSYYYRIFSQLNSPVTANNTGQIGVNAPIEISARFLGLTASGVVIGSTYPVANDLPVTSAALNITSTNRGFLPPRLSSSSSISYGIGSVTVSNGGSGYGTGTGVVVTISGGGGSGAAISLTYSGGVITGATVLLKGHNYTSAPTITISGGTGSGAVLTCTLEAMPNGLEFFNTTTNRTQVAINSSFYSIAYTQDIKRDTSYQITNTNLDISGQTANFKNRYHTVRIATAVTAAATANNVITMPVPHADLLGINFKVSVVDVSGDSDISQLSFGTDGVDGYLSNGDGTYALTQNLYPGLGVYVSVAWDQNKSAYRWFLQ